MATLIVPCPKMMIVCALSIISVVNLMSLCIRSALLCVASHCFVLLCVALCCFVLSGGGLSLKPCGGCEAWNFQVDRCLDPLPSSHAKHESSRWANFPCCLAGSWKGTVREILRCLSDVNMLTEMGFAARYGVQYTPLDPEFTEEVGMSQILFNLVVALSGTEIKDGRTYSVLSMTT